ncbi:MAG: hypothetical protein C6P37_10955 [Caldibacillus debilis]|uniref:Uncharacterized protein n=1 Tax=Caldibacillus debilis TaxID=301148 RepID=A0A3E0K2W2_9BACI|nr:MAG: hypothetical protein BAA03_08935 [Caldibacillus debilis]REJ17131.1 MAG: hypothetical protein C6W57_06035 [Caldibacillus debilis]REJ27619.1 MAG: hypothetical protein C6P37_10955 [Caldibacillus debilis]
MNRDLVAGKIFAGSQGRRGWSPDAEGPVIRDPGDGPPAMQPERSPPLFAGVKDSLKTGENVQGNQQEVRKPKTPLFSRSCRKKN